MKITIENINNGSIGSIGLTLNNEGLAGVTLNGEETSMQVEDMLEELSRFNQFALEHPTTDN